jgi:hypothetical protein
MFICDGFENGGKVLRIRCRGCEDITLISINDLDLSTLVEVCYVDGEEMIVGEEYEVADNGFPAFKNVFLGVLDNKPYFRDSDGNTFTWDQWKLVEPVTTYTLVKSVDGKEVSRTEVSEEKAEELC